MNWRMNLMRSCPPDSPSHPSGNKTECSCLLLGGDVKKNAGNIIRSTTPDKRLTKISNIRELFHALEEAKRNGVSHVALVAALKEIGIDVTVKSLSRMLMQIRRDEGSVASRTKQHKFAKAVPSVTRSTASKEPDVIGNPSVARAKGQQMADMYITPANQLLANLTPT